MFDVPIRVTPGIENHIEETVKMPIERMLTVAQLWWRCDTKERNY